MLSRPLLADMPATRLAFLFTCVALPGHWLLAASQLDSVWPAEGRGPGLAGWAAVLYGGVLSTGLAYSLWNASLRRIGRKLDVPDVTTLLRLLRSGALTTSLAP